MTVDDKFAGKKGKCNKCGSAVQVPSTATGPAQQPKAAAKTSGSAQPKTASSSSPGAVANSTSPALLNAAPPPSAAGIKVQGPLDHVLNELTESDFNRHSPFQNVYAPPKPKAVNNEMLNRAEKMEQKEKGAKKSSMGSDGRPALTSTIKLFAALDILQAVLLFGLVLAIAIVGMSFLDEVKDKIPLLGAGLAIFIMILGLFATTLMAAGLGLLTKQLWGYCVALSVYAFLLGVRVLVVIANISDFQSLAGPAFLALCMLSFTAYFFRDECRNVFGIPKRSKLPWICLGAGLSVALLLGGGLFFMGALATAGASADAPVLPP